MLGRVARLTRAELLKLANHPFFPIALALLAAATLLGAWGQSAALGSKESVWRNPNSLLLFALGAKFGLKMASFLLVIFGSLFFAGEFDRGTIKILLTRPITRTELFAAKCLTGLLLAAFLFAAVLALSFGFGCARGELGPVWDDEVYLTTSSYEDLAAHAEKAVVVSAAGVAAAVFLGIAVSTFVESSGFAIAIALTFFIGVDLGLGFVREEHARYVFSWYPSRAFDILQQFARGSSDMGWRSAIGDRVDVGLMTVPISLLVPAVTAAVCSAIGYVLFRIRNILA
jgi:ABC-type transport system involved in multi-copper enzyme maturation permease subunit